ncbi:hypothetical protein BJ170DRAFT_635906 [Xylariales sp. AK1849]|nr:hypothetical protein BJ170DRAFT_635906 [Xylariales sp. AK1849]
MNINVPGFIEAAIPKDKLGNRNVGIIANNMDGPNHNDPRFLSDEFPKNPPKLYVTSEEDEFDVETVEQWQDEGFNVEYLPLGDGDKEYKLKLDGLRKQGLGPCETFGIVAYGEAASVCLEHFHILDNNPDFKLGLLVAYYPTRIPDPNLRFPGGVQVLVHLTGDEIKVLKQSQMVGIQGKKRMTRKRIDNGVGTGSTLKMGFPAYSYDADSGFAEHDLDEFEKVSADLAWSRSLAAARRAFRWEFNLQGVVEENSQHKFYTKNEEKLVSTYATKQAPNVTYMPTLTGAIGTEELEKFYGDYFIHSNPTSLELTLISRTSSADRVVDELHVAFKHTQDMPWILPGVPATNKRVEIMVVSIVTLRGGKLYHERVYWDQASVLVQVGLLNPNFIPKKARERGVEKLPVVGRRAARRVIEGGYDDTEGEADNELIPEFWDEDEDDEDDEDDEEEEEVDEETEREEDGESAEEQTEAETAGEFDDEGEQETEQEEEATENEAGPSSHVPADEHPNGEARPKAPRKSTENSFPKQDKAQKPNGAQKANGVQKQNGTPRTENSIPKEKIFRKGNATQKQNGVHKENGPQKQNGAQKRNGVQKEDDHETQSNASHRTTIEDTEDQEGY